MHRCSFFKRKTPVQYIIYLHHLHHSLASRRRYHYVLETARQLLTTAALMFFVLPAAHVTFILVMRVFSAGPASILNLATIEDGGIINNLPTATV
jgi:hypothetical protein